MAGSGDLWDAANQLLGICVAALADTPAGAPEFYYVSEGVPAWDCELLAVHVGGPALGDTLPLQPSLAPGHRVTVNAQVNLVSLTATVIRCVPVINDSGIVPTAQDHDTSSAQTLADLWAIWNHVRQAKKTEALFPPREREFFMDPAVGLTTQGGFAGWQISFRTQLPGYVPA